MQRKKLRGPGGPRSQGEFFRRTALSLLGRSLLQKRLMIDKNTSAKLCNRDLGSRSRRGNTLIPNNPFLHSAQTRHGIDRFDAKKLAGSFVEKARFHYRADRV